MKYLIILCFSLRQKFLVLVFYISLYFYLFVRLRRLFCLLFRIAVDYVIWFFMLGFWIYWFCFFHS